MEDPKPQLKRSSLGNQPLTLVDSGRVCLRRSWEVLITSVANVFVNAHRWKSLGGMMKRPGDALQPILFTLR